MPHKPTTPAASAAGSAGASTGAASSSSPAAPAVAASTASGGGPNVTAGAVATGSRSATLRTTTPNRTTSSPSSSSSPTIAFPNLQSPYFPFEDADFLEAFESAASRHIETRDEAPRQPSIDERASALRGGLSKPSDSEEAAAGSYDLSVAERAVQLSCRLTKKVQAQLRREAEDVTRSKPDKSYVTVADWGVQAVVSWVLKQAYPGEVVSMIAEEDTKQLTNDAGSTLLARLVGVVNECLAEARLVGIEPPERPLEAPEPVEKANSNQTFTAGLADLLGISNAPLRVYSMAKYAAIARGDADIFMKFARNGYQEKVWDHAAGVVIVEEAGGVVTDAGGKPLDFTRGRFLSSLDRGIVASSSLELHQQLLTAIDASWRVYHGGEFTPQDTNTLLMLQQQDLMQVDVPCGNSARPFEGPNQELLWLRRQKLFPLPAAACALPGQNGREGLHEGHAQQEGNNADLGCC
ncbi:unnamed protein product [Closterium sp. Naga37s-1]|nr:unnamed protein product [Closterium sp. Naga37s-1]